MTFDDALEQYGSVELTFESLYKGMASFVGTAEDGAEITGTMGEGTFESAYYLTVYNNQKVKLEDFRAFRIEKDKQELIDIYPF